MLFVVIIIILLLLFGGIAAARRGVLRQTISIDEPVEIADAEGPWVTVVERCDCAPSQAFPLGETQWRLHYGEGMTHTIRGRSPGTSKEDILTALTAECDWLKFRLSAYFKP